MPRGPAFLNQNKTKMSKEDCVKEILEATKTQVKGFDDSKLIMAILDKFEAEVRVDQCKKDQKMAMNIINQNKDDRSGNI